VLLDYVPYLMSLVYQTMNKGGSEGVNQTIEIMKSYDLELDHLKEHLPDLTFTLNKQNLFTSLIPSK
jgi:hypothetical protein